ncbi:hypothetical protein [Pseudomonas sp. NFX15]|uniref:hypothetical protein n=1 Tax=Pseudomonas sp. NFX15 TaxID=2816958 RepID=UPI003B9E4DC2
MGETQCKVLSHNCEHFCNWCISDISHSTQVAEFPHFPFRLITQVYTRESDLHAEHLKYGPTQPLSSPSVLLL